MLTPIKITQHPQLGPSVSGRELYKLIAVSKSERDGFSDWFRSRQAKFNLIEGKDFIETSVLTSGSNRRWIEFIVTLSVVKQLATVATRDRGTGVIAFVEAYELNPAIATETDSTTPPTEPVNKTTLFDSAEPKVTKLWPIPDATLDTTPAPVEGSALSPIQQLLQQATQLAEAEARRESEQVKPSEELASVEARLSTMEGRVNTVLNFFFQAATALKGYEPIGEPAEAVAVNSEPVAPPTTRAILVRLVNSYSAADRKSEHDTWKYLYGQFDLRTGFNAYAQTSNRVRDVSYLSVIEERGQIDALYELAKKLLVLPALK